MKLTPDFKRLDDALAPWPRAILAHTPTPLDFLPRLSKSCHGHRLYLKRDDCTGLAMGGNKARQLEFYLGDAMEQGCDVVLSTGAVQSNYMRSLAAAAAKLGLECHIQLESRLKTEDRDYHQSGNVLLNQLLGAHIHHYEAGEDELGADRRIRAIADELSAAGRKPYIVPLAPVPQPKGALGYVAGVRELVNQLVEQEVTPDLVVVGSGSGLTHAGMVVGMALLGVDIPILGACVRRPAADQGPRVLETCRKVERMLGCEGLVHDRDVQVTESAFAPGYGQQSDHVMAAISRIARLEGVLVDPVYTGKTIAATLSWLEDDAHASDQTIVMIHTGGTPALFAYRQTLLDRIGGANRD